MSEQTRIEITGNIQVHHPVKLATVAWLADWNSPEDAVYDEQVAA